MINKATPDNTESCPKNLRASSELSTIGPVSLHSEKRIIPTTPQAEALEVLHAAHQDTGMTAGAMSSVQWPGMPTNQTLLPAGLHQE